MSFYPHGYCLSWNPTVLWMHVGSDLVIFLSYMVISMVMLLWLSMRWDRLMSRVRPGLVLTAFFIFFCGLTHIAAVIVVWRPEFVMEGIIKVMTATISAMTAGVFVLAYRFVSHVLQGRARRDAERD